MPSALYFRVDKNIFELSFVTDGAFGPNSTAAEARQAEKEYYQSLTPAQRIQITLMLTKAHYGADFTGKIERVVTIVRRADLK